MDNQALFGPTVYHLPLSRAIEQDLLADYRIVIPEIHDSDLHEILASPLALDTVHDGLHLAGLQTAVLRAIADHKLRRVLVFHQFTATCDDFAATLTATSAIAPERLNMPNLWSGSVHGRQPVSVRHRTIEQFRQGADWAPGTNRANPAHRPCNVLSNVRMFGEGLDVHDLDAVVFAAPKRSAVDINQAVGRALRQPPGAGKKATLVIPVFLTPGQDFHDGVDSSGYEALWQVLLGLRAHDDRLLDRIADPEQDALRGLIAYSMGGTRPERADEIARLMGLRTFTPDTPYWLSGFTAATAYQCTYGHLDVPRTWRNETGMELGAWITHHRRLHAAWRDRPDPRRGARGDRHAVGRTQTRLRTRSHQRPLVRHRPRSPRHDFPRELGRPTTGLLARRPAA